MLELDYDFVFVTSWFARSFRERFSDFIECG